VVFIENYDMRIARAMVAGVDVWLNTPRRPHEASGTSGMKASANGALNLSVLDGWWAEAWERFGRDVGWAVGRGEEYAGAEGDDIEAESLYGLLENEVAPLFFQTEARDGVPRAWIARMKHAIAKVVPTFNTVRMVREYATLSYVPAARMSQAMVQDGLQGAKDLSAWKERVRAAWAHIKINLVASQQVPHELSPHVEVGHRLRVEASVHLGTLTPSDVVVELYFGLTHGGHDIARGEIAGMQLVHSDGAQHVYEGHVPVERSGAHAYAVRVMPHNSAMSHPYEMSLIRWA